MRESLLTNTRAHRLNSSPVLSLNSTCSASCSILKIPQPRSGRSSSEYQEDVEISVYDTMDKRNEKTVKKDETMELTMDQMDKISAGGVPEIMGLQSGGESEDDPWWKDEPWTQH